MCEHVSPPRSGWESPRRRPAAHTPRVAKSQRTPLEKALVGPAGEHFVLFQLYQHGLMASLAPPGSPTIDILVLAADESVIATLQVKTRTIGRDKGWHMKEKHESFDQPRGFYVFVDLEPEHPVCYVVPSGVVAKVLREAHQMWLNTPGKGGKQHNDHGMRRLLPKYELEGFTGDWLEPYREAWTSIASGLKPSPGTAQPLLDPEAPTQPAAWSRRK